MSVVPVNFAAVFVSALAAMVIGALWFGPLFGRRVAALSGRMPGKAAAAKKKGTAPEYALQFLGALVMAFVTAHSLLFAGAYLDITGVSAGLMTGVWNWLGFVAPVTMGAVLWEGKSWELWFLKSGHYLVTLCVMGIILAVWR